MGRAEEIERLEEAIIVLEASIRRREASAHPEKYKNCLAQDRYRLAKHRRELEELKQRGVADDRCG
jgi:hypothetical protein